MTEALILLTLMPYSAQLSEEEFHSTADETLNQLQEKIEVSFGSPSVPLVEFQLWQLCCQIHIICFS